jgi:hypothetical protein
MSPSKQENSFLARDSACLIGLDGAQQQLFLSLEAVFNGGSAGNLNKE